MEDLRHILLLEPNNKQAKADLEEVAKAQEVRNEIPKVLKENSPPTFKGDNSKVKGMFVTKSTPKGYSFSEYFEI